VGSRRQTAPHSVVPTVAEHTLVPPSDVEFPSIPSNTYDGVRRSAVRFLAVHNPLQLLDFGPQYNAADTSGVITIEPPGRDNAFYGILVPQGR